MLMHNHVQPPPPPLVNFCKVAYMGDTSEVIAGCV